MKINTAILFLSRKLFSILPDTRAYRIKCFLLRCAGIKVGNNVRICSTVKIIGCSSLEIGDNTFIGHDSIIICTAPIEIGKNVNIAPRCYIGTGSHLIDPTGESIAGRGDSLPIKIEDGAWLCACSTILAGSIVGKMSIVAAGAVVKGTVNERELVGGILAKHIRSL